MGEIFTVADLPGYTGWRETLEEKHAYERRRREIEEARERKRKAVVAEKQQPAVTNNWDAWYVAIDQRIEQHFLSGDLGVGDALKAAIGDALGRKAAQVRDEFKRAIEEMRCALEAKLAEQNERFVASNSQATWVGWVDDRIKATFGYGRDVLLADVKDIVEEAQRLLEARFVAVEERVKAGLPSKLPIAKAYRSDSVHYSGDLVTHAGATYQATCDTCREPPHDDWVRIASAGRDGHTPNFHGRYNAHKKYRRLDVVEFDGSSFVALCDDPGIPGDPGWQLLSRNGSRGPAGEIGPRGQKGERGGRGQDASTIVAWSLDRKNFRAIPTMSNGKQGAVLELRGLFEQFVEETSYAAE